MIIKKRNQNLGEVKNDAEMSIKDASVSEFDISAKPAEEQIEAIAQKEPEIDLFDIENIDFTQRVWRRSLPR